MVCEKCLDKGFTEQEHGLVRIFCDCEKGKELRAEITGEPNDKSVESRDDLRSPTGDDLDNSTTGGGDTSQPQLAKKPKSKKKAGKRTR